MYLAFIIPNSNVALKLQNKIKTQLHPEEGERNAKKKKKKTWQHLLPSCHEPLKGVTFGTF